MGVAPSGAIIGARKKLGAECAASRSGPMFQPTGKPTSSALLPSSFGGISCAPSGAIETSSLYGLSQIPSSDSESQL